MMYSHAPEDYDCPFCRLTNGQVTSGSTQADVIWHDGDVTAFVPTGWWPNNVGHVLIIPNRHYENIYTLPPELGTPIARIAQRLAIAFKELYECDGVSTRQHNEPHGNQDVWHYHLHVFPRYEGDDLYLSRRRNATAAERRPFSEKLRAWLSAPENQL